METAILIIVILIYLAQGAKFASHGQFRFGKRTMVFKREGTFLIQRILLMVTWAPHIVLLYLFHRVEIEDGDPM